MVEILHKVLRDRRILVIRLLQIIFNRVSVNECRTSVIQEAKNKQKRKRKPAEVSGDSGIIMQSTLCSTLLYTSYRGFPRGGILFPRRGHTKVRRMSRESAGYQNPRTFVGEPGAVSTCVHVVCTCGYISLHNSSATVAAAINFTALALVYHQPDPDRKSVMREEKGERKKE
ncbi:hypothetical protein ACS0PU_009295 [Formica fusca]